LHDNNNDGCFNYLEEAIVDYNCERTPVVC